MPGTFTVVTAIAVQLWPEVERLLRTARDEIYRLMEMVRPSSSHPRLCVTAAMRAQDSYPRFRCSKGFITCIERFVPC
jgi:hypothetical protein